MRTEKPKIDLSTAKNLFVEHRETIREVFRHAVEQALLEHKRAGNRIAATTENGELVWIEPEQIKAEQSI